MHVDVHGRRLDLDEQQHRREAVPRHGVAVGLLDGVGQDAVLDRPPVHEQVLAVASGKALGGTAGEAVNPESGPLELKRQQPSGLSAVDVVGPLHRVACLRRLQQCPRPLDETEPDVGAGQGEAADPALHVGQLRGLGAQELPSGRKVEEQTGDLDGRPAHPTDLPHRKNLTPADLDLGCRTVLGGGAEREARDGRDAR
jgi:hypothetical protein